MKLLILAALLFCTHVHAQIPQDIQDKCRAHTKAIAGIVTDPAYSRIRSKLTLDNNPQGWMEKVTNYMIYAGSTSTSLTAQELQTIGYAYCLEQRPGR